MSFRNVVPPLAVSSSLGSFADSFKSSLTSVSLLTSESSDSMMRNILNVDIRKVPSGLFIAEEGESGENQAVQKKRKMEETPNTASQLDDAGLLLDIRKTVKNNNTEENGGIPVNQVNGGLEGSTNNKPFENSETFYVLKLKEEKRFLASDKSLFDELCCEKPSKTKPGPKPKRTDFCESALNEFVAFIADEKSKIVNKDNEDFVAYLEQELLPYKFVHANTMHSLFEFGVRERHAKGRLPLVLEIRCNLCKALNGKKQEIGRIAFEKTAENKYELGTIGRSHPHPDCEAILSRFTGKQIPKALEVHRTR